jgi:hypothetical protein
MPSKFKLIVYYDTSYASPFLVKIGSPIVCFHPMQKSQQNNERSILEGFYMDFYFIICLLNIFEILAYNILKVNNI